MPRGKVQDTKHQEEKSHAKTQRRKGEDKIGNGRKTCRAVGSAKVEEHKERKKERQR
jgi:hypothetical protein